MSTKIRPTTIKTTISKHRFYELKHFCLQYREWKEQYDRLGLDLRALDTTKEVRTDVVDHTANIAIMRAELYSKMKLVEDCASCTHAILGPKIFKAVTEDLGYYDLDIPCSKGYYYKYYHKFFELLDEKSLQKLQAV